MEMRWILYVDDELEKIRWEESMKNGSVVCYYESR
jgi:hypothetical protein